MPTLDDQLEQDRPCPAPGHRPRVRSRDCTAASRPVLRPRRRTGDSRAMRPVLATMAVAASALVAVIVVTNRDDTATFPDRGRAGRRGQTSRGSDGAADPEAAVTESDAAAPSAGLTAPSPQSKPAPSNAIPTEGRTRRATRAHNDPRRRAEGRQRRRQSDAVGRRARPTLAGDDPTASGGSASFVLSIPTARLDTALEALSGLADVDSLSQDSRDITGGFVTAADRLSDARTERKAILRALGKASNAGQIATLRKRLAMNSSEIARYKGDLDALATPGEPLDRRGHHRGNREPPPRPGWRLDAGRRGPRRRAGARGRSRSNSDRARRHGPTRRTRSRRGARRTAPAPPSAGKCARSRLTAA